MSSAKSVRTSGKEGTPLFFYRGDDLDTLVRSLADPDGSHFWLVIAPPKFGKSLFLDRLKAKVAPPQASSWGARLVDVRENLEMRRDAGRLLAHLFSLTSPVTIGQETLRDIARNISKGGKPYLCLLDSAELLEEETGRTLRSCLSRIHDLVQEAGNVDVRLALVVASRKEDEWRGVAPAPRLVTLPLSQFKPTVVRQALQSLAQEMRRTFDPTVLQRNAMRVYHLTEGLPVLVAECLQWIREEEWLDLDRLEDRQLFEELAQPYIQMDLFSKDSLLPRRRQYLGDQRDEQARSTLKEAFRFLAPYRFFTLSHLRHHFELDVAFAETLDQLSWAIEDLWEAISRTDLLLQPLNEPWQEIHPAIRRALYRYYYKSQEQRVDAHHAARKFIEVWADKQTGREQVIGLVECLWHEAAVLRLNQPSSLEEELMESAKKLSRTLRPSPAYTVTELRAYAAERMRNDEELQEAVGEIPVLLERLVEIVTGQPQE